VSGCTDAIAVTASIAAETAAAIERFQEALRIRHPQQVMGWGESGRGGGEGARERERRMGESNRLQGSQRLSARAHHSAPPARISPPDRLDANNVTSHGREGENADEGGLAD
jgi:hypothetical protein